MTNFEKWKNKLNIADMIKILSMSCNGCPIVEQDEQKCISRLKGFGSCMEAIQKWGESEVQNNENKFQIWKEWGNNAELEILAEENI